MATAEDERPRGSSTSLVTTCGRRIAVRCLRLAPADRPISRVTLDVGRGQGDEPGAWAALTADEARGLAHLLLRQAGVAESAAEGRTRPGSPYR
ncbi:hypothetical protein ACIQAC_30045 [Streptomyces sp. NPDC088387]|uniref:hypothetical protein n=1 Tax=Streptomyces sp. NPDC088387 TaxID=3365859 RepID=UPI0037FD1DA1